jgi:hypothetical protein
MEYPLSNVTCRIEFGSSLKNISLFYLKQLFDTSYRTSQKPYLPQVISLKV